MYLVFPFLQLEDWFSRLHCCSLQSVLGCLGSSSDRLVIMSEEVSEETQATRNIGMPPPSIIAFINKITSLIVRSE